MWVRPLWFSAPQLLTHLQISFIVLRQWQMHVGVSGATVTKRVRKKLFGPLWNENASSKKIPLFSLGSSTIMSGFCFGVLSPWVNWLWHQCAAIFFTLPLVWSAYYNYTLYFLAGGNTGLAVCLVCCGCFVFCTLVVFLRSYIYEGSVW